MKLLVDANISWRLLRTISQHFPDSVHVDSITPEIPLKDLDIWNFALEHNYMILTNDEDFFELSMFKGYPPKLIILRTGNVSTRNLSRVLINHIQEIEQFAESEDLGILEIY
jgi:predicted nuclease of predicted toxin-antitoxin system